MVVEWLCRFVIRVSRLLPSYMGRARGHLNTDEPWLLTNECFRRPRMDLAAERHGFQLLRHLRRLLSIVSVRCLKLASDPGQAVVSGLKAGQLTLAEADRRWARFVMLMGVTVDSSLRSPPSAVPWLGGGDGRLAPEGSPRDARNSCDLRGARHPLVVTHESSFPLSPCIDVLLVSRNPRVVTGAGLVRAAGLSVDWLDERVDADLPSCSSWLGNCFI